MIESVSHRLAATCFAETLVSIGLYERHHEGGVRCAQRDLVRVVQLQPLDRREQLHRRRLHAHIQASNPTSSPHELVLKMGA